ncbi:MAG: DUF3054 family protein [Armatimonadota bacterium]|nr:DUF3054 family protein [Armatimonadota bacterium]MDR7438122.1 DUF3054 family protein [Armatimonadota bacterium]MDR7472220.1 DUF3054 family protein [Armatimonadota bacterium]MDR7507721.1 DUF3054 family protein [Armatimonadota bacterium]MDR7510174.1 DUF3054 family protein [Armatimonadota bacterium]
MAIPHGGRAGPAPAGRIRRLLVAADALGLLVFVAAGVRVHGGLLTARAVARDAVPLLAAWWALAPLTGVYRNPGWVSLLRHWAVAVPAGLLVRQVLLGRPLGRGTLVFLAAAWVFTAVCVGAARLAARIAAGWP